MFSPIETPRLLIRAPVSSDAEALYLRRNHPEAARYQNWQLPFPRESAEAYVSDVVSMAGPEDEEWWMATVELGTGEVIGDLVVHLTSAARSAEIGYTFSPQFWGKGYAVEATDAFVRYLFEDLGVHRVWGMLHPDNVASAMVLERVGMLFEGHTRGSFWLGDDNSDDWIYGMLRPDWEAWAARPRARPAVVELREVTSDDLDRVMSLKTHRSQERMVAPIAWTLAEALFPGSEDGGPVVPWLRSIVADGEIVGALMVALQTEHHSEPYLWRLLIDRLHQRRGVGRLALDALFEEMRGMGSKTIATSWAEGRGSPRRFYEGLGFVPTGEIDDGEVVARKPL
jgi:RimJ/RimL family protein N-acetyltransferase